jgi:3-oxoacyl-[acyl-carrier protein] reductase
MLGGKIALVTGGSKGLGRAIVENFLNDGYRVAFTYLNSEAKAKEISECYGDMVLPIQADASDYNKAFEVVEKVVSVYGTIDVLVNNVALAKDKPIWKMDIESWNFGINNTLGPCFNYTRAAIEVFIKNKKGKIINIGSINGIRGREGSISYSTAKAGIIGFTKTIAKELGEFNINANVVAPGFIDTDGQQNTSQLIRGLVLDECAIRRLSTPEDVSHVVEFLASDKSNNITGQVIQIDNGQYI